MSVITKMIFVIRKISDIFELYFVSGNEEESYKYISNSFKIRRF